MFGIVLDLIVGIGAHSFRVLLIGDAGNHSGLRGEMNV